MQCYKCKSKNLDIVQSGPHRKLVCADCLAFQKFLTRSEADSFTKLKQHGQAKDEVQTKEL